MNEQKFSDVLLKWHASHPRFLPWKLSKDPYLIWLSEVILQQTRVAQGIPYYERFKKLFPTVFDLANASEEKVIKAWEGLGYYSRARNLHHAAKQIVNLYNGKFPENYHEILALKGIGTYTAAAISSFAFGGNYAVVDGNVNRVISRLLGIQEPAEDKNTKKRIRKFVDTSICYVQSDLFNQAIMDFGATQCKPSKPDCTKCPFSEYCIAQVNNLTDIIPIKQKRITKKNRYFHFIDIQDNTNILIMKREKNDIWNKLYCLPVLESESSQFNLEENISEFLIKDLFIHPDSIKCLFKISVNFQMLTHQKIHASFYKLQLDEIPDKIKSPYYLVESKKVSNFAFPKVINDYLQSHQFFICKS